MPILSNFPTGGADPERYATITFYDWDDTLIGSIAVKKGADASDAVAAFEDAHKADTFDEGSQFYSSDATKPLTNKKGYTFEGVWLDNDSDVRTHYGAAGWPGQADIPKPKGVTFDKVDRNMRVKACYGTNSECGSGVTNQMYYTTNVVGYNRESTINHYYIYVQIKRENNGGAGVPRLAKPAFKVQLSPEAEGSVALYFRKQIEKTDSQILPLLIPSSIKRVQLSVIDLYGNENFLGTGTRSDSLSIYKGSVEEKDGFVYLGTMRSVNDAAAPGGTIGNINAATLRDNLGMDVKNPNSSGNFTAANLRAYIQTAWRTKNGADYETKDPSEYVDLTWEEMQYAIKNEGELLMVGQSLAETSWKQIAAISEYGLAPTYWSVGDEKDIVVNGETLTLAIMDFNHDDKSDGSGKAGITFGMKNLMATERRMEATNTNANGFTGSELYTWLQGELLSSLPSDLQSVLKFVDKKTSAGNQSTEINTDSMKLFLFSEVEVFGATTYSVEGEGEQYSHFATAANRKKYITNGAGSVYFWWERSPSANYSWAFCFANINDSPIYGDSSNSYGVCFGFCV